MTQQSRAEGNSIPAKFEGPWGFRFSIWCAFVSLHVWLAWI